MEEEILKKHNLKITESRKLILNIIHEKQEPMTAKEIYQIAKQHISLNYSTVYRILSVFTDKKILLKSIGTDKTAYYQLNGHKHSHYLICSECHRKIPIEECPLEEISEKLVEQTGFHITGHTLEFVGECPDCMKKKQVKKK